MSKVTDEDRAEAENQWRKKHNRIKHIVRYRPEGQCFQCGQIKKELMEDPDNPSKLHNEMYIYCDTCYNTMMKNYKDKGRWP